MPSVSALEGGVVRRLVALLCGLTAFWCAGRALAETPAGIRITRVPSWVEPVPVRKDAQPAQSSGVQALLYDFQTRAVAGTRWRFVRSALRVSSEIGIPIAAQQKLTFVPPHERVEFHRLEVQRGAQATSQLDLSKIRLLSREPNLESSVYDGSRTAVMELGDLRVGDTVVYEYSIIGQNPVLGGHVMESWGLGLTWGAAELRHRLVTDRSLALFTSAGARPPAETSSQGLHDWRWQSTDLAALTAEEHVPDDFDLLPFAQLTDFASWAEVARWADGLFRVPKVAPRVAALAEEIQRQARTPAERALLALRRVQEEVRYLSLAFAESSHRPAAPETVLERRAGDCKDKSLLLMTLLSKLGIEARVALVATSGGRRLPELLPNARSFDHVVVTFELEGQRHFVDPTRLYQRGRLSDVAVRGFGHALVVSPATTALTEVPDLVDGRPDVFVVMNVAIERFGGPTTLVVSAKYTGFRAESYRALKAAGSSAELDKVASSIVLNAYPRAKPLDSVSVEDDESSNELTVRRRYALDDVWVRRGDVVELSLMPPWLYGLLPGVEGTRTAPLEIPHPLRVVHRIDVNTPEPLAMKEDSQHLEVGAFGFDYRVERAGPTLSLHYSLETRGRRVELVALPEYRQAMADLGQRVEVKVWKDGSAGKGGRPSLPIVLFAALWTVLLLVLVYWVQKTKPYLQRENVPYDSALSGRRGWLMLLGFGVSIAPLRILASVVESLPAYSASRFAALTTEGGPSYHPSWELVLLFDLPANLTLVVGSVYVAYLYWAGARSFPLAFVGVYGFGLLVPFVEAFLGSGIPELAATREVPSAIGSSVGTALWTLYVLQSRRVKATFLPGPEPPAARKRKKRRAPTELREPES